MAVHAHLAGTLASVSSSGRWIRENSVTRLGLKAINSFLSTALGLGQGQRASPHFIGKPVSPRSCPCPQTGLIKSAPNNQEM